MTYKKFIEEPMPSYSRGEEIFNYVTHIIGIVIAVVLFIFSIVLGFLERINFREFFSLMILSFGCFSVYAISTAYHGLHSHRISKRIFRIIDHCDIYLLVAGTYTPVCLIGLYPSIWCWIILGIEWSMAIFGIIINALNMNALWVKILSMIFYIVGGWIVIFFPPAIKLIPTLAFIFILAGGISYTFGSILYGIGSKKKWFHSIFHIFCLIGTILQIIGIITLLY